MSPLLFLEEANFQRSTKITWKFLLMSLKFFLAHQEKFQTTTPTTRNSKRQPRPHTLHTYLRTDFASHHHYHQSSHHHLSSIIITITCHMSHAKLTHPPYLASCNRLTHTLYLSAFKYPRPSSQSPHFNPTTLRLPLPKTKNNPKTHNGRCEFPISLSLFSFTVNVSADLCVNINGFLLMFLGECRRRRAAAAAAAAALRRRRRRAPSLWS